MATVEGNRERCRIELTEAESAATGSRDAAHALDLAVERRQQQLTFDRRQIETLAGSLGEVAGEIEALRARRDPARSELETQIEEARRCGAERDEVGAGLQAREDELAQAQRALDGLEGDVEAARSEVFAAVNAATALQHAIEHASASHGKLGESLTKLDAEAAGSRHRVPGDRGRGGAPRRRGARDEGGPRTGRLGLRRAGGRAGLRAPRARGARARPARGASRGWRA